MLSKRIQTLTSSMTIAISTLAMELKSQGKDVFSFSAGEPDFDTPVVIKDAAKKALDDGHTKYTPVVGIPSLIKAIQTKLKRDNGLNYATSEIISNVGAKHSLFNLFQALVDDGDEVIIPAPYWVTYPELVTFSGGTPVILDTKEENTFKITADELKAAITPKTKMLILTTPSNPTGAVYSKAELLSIANVLKGTNVWVCSDEMYEKLLYDGKKFTSVAGISADMMQRTITINGLSKSVAMTGWRFGYMATKNKDLMDAIKKLQSHSTSNINSITQHAAIIALEGKADSDIEKMRVEFEKRRNIAAYLVNESPKLSVVKPDGAFYLFINITKVSNDSLAFAKELLEEVGVALVPGIAFGMEGFIRLSFATDEATIREGIKRIRNFVESK